MFEFVVVAMVAGRDRKADLVARFEEEWSHIAVGVEFRGPRLELAATDRLQTAQEDDLSWENPHRGPGKTKRVQTRHFDRLLTEEGRGPWPGWAWPARYACSHCSPCK